MRRAALLLLWAPCLAPAGEDVEARPPPLIFFRDPDPETARRIQSLVSSKELGSGTRDIRTKARGALADIGEWTIPALSESLFGKKRDKANRVRMNSCLSMARVLDRGRVDPRLLAALRGAAREDEDFWIRRAALLVLAGFERIEPRSSDFALLEEALQNPDSARKDQEAAALAMAKLGAPGAAQALLTALDRPGLPERQVAACLLGVILVAPQAAESRCSAHLKHDSKLVRLVAATGLGLRPVPAERLADVQARLRVERDRFVRARLVHAIAAVPAEGERIRELLLTTAGDLDEKGEVRVAAFVTLADTFGPEEGYPRLRGLLKTQNDPVYGANLFALARTGADAAIDDLLRAAKAGSIPQQTYAAGCLAHLVAFAPVKREREIFSQLTAVQSRAQNDQFKRFLEAILDLNSPKGRELRARDLFQKFPDPDGIGLWTHTRETRGLRFVNDLLPAIFDLDDIVARQGMEGGVMPERRTASPDEVDLLDFFQEAPYFGPEDVVAR
ncbi:MAG: hypothetical protein ACT4PV_08185 [Planctomycetaceae bacterium]